MIYMNNIKTKKQPLKSIKLVFLGFIVFLSSIVSLPIFYSQNVSAEPSLTITTEMNNTSPTDTVQTLAEQKTNDPDWQIKSLIYLRAIKVCGLGDTRWNGSVDAVPYELTIEDAKRGSQGENKNRNPGWFTDSMVDLGVYMKDTLANDTEFTKYFQREYNWDGQYRCSGESLVPKALSLWNLNPIETLCNAGFVSGDKIDGNGNPDYNQSIQECINLASSRDAEYLVALSSVNNSSSKISQLINYISKKVYGATTEPSFTNNLRYYFYRRSLNNSCILDIETLEPNPINNPGSDGYKDVEWLDYDTYDILVGSYGRAGGNLIGADKVFPKTEINLGFINDDYVDPFFFTGNPWKMTCNDAVLTMNQFTEDAQRYARITGDVIDPNSSNTTSSQGSTTSCAISGIGWLLCPVINFLSSIADGAFVILQGFLHTNPKIVETDGGTHQVWKIVNNIANFAFLIVAMIVIFSQITGVGITNYGIKKIFPKLIIVAILVNLSFYICQIAVDLSNIIGQSAKGLFDGVALQIPIGNVPSHMDGKGVFAGIAGSVLGTVGGGVIIYAALPVLIPAVLSAVVALVMILVLLIARQAIIVLLVIVSPLAFIAYLLPNTEKLFKSWQKMGMSMLMLYPIVAVVVGASGLASTVLNQTFINMDQDTGGFIGQIAAAMVGVLPLFVVPGLLKKSMDGVGGIGKMINGIGDKAGKGFGGLGKKAYDNSSLARGRITRKATKEQFKNLTYARNLQSKSLLGKTRRLAATGISASLAGSKLGQKFTNSSIGKLGPIRDKMNLYEKQRNAVSTSADATVQAAKAKELSDEAVLIDKLYNDEKLKAKPDTDGMLSAIVKNQSLPAIKRRAAMDRLARDGRTKELRALRINPDVDKAELQSAITTNAGAIINKAPDLIKGPEAAFKNISAEEITKLSADGGAAYMDYIASTIAGSQERRSAVNAFNQAMTMIGTRSNTSLRSAFKQDIASSIIKHSSLSSTTDPDLIRMATVAGTIIDSDGNLIP